MKKIFLFLLPLILFSYSQSAYAAITIEYTTVNAQATNDVTFSHNGGTGDDDVIILIAHRYGATCIDAVSYAGVAATKDSTNVDLAYIYRVSNATAGSNSVVVDFCAGSVGRENRVTALTLSGVDHTSPVVDDEYKKAGVNLPNPLTLYATSTVANAFSVSTMTGGGSYSPSSTGGQTIITSGSLGTNVYGQAYEYITTSGLNSQIWQGGTGSGDYAGVIVVYRPADEPVPEATSTATSSISVDTTFSDAMFLLFSGTVIFLFVFFGFIYYFKKRHTI